MTFQTDTIPTNIAPWIPRLLNAPWMAFETHDAHCVGWLNHQLGRGNNIGLRLSMMSCENIRDLKLDGEQHETFEDTLPQ